MPPEELSHTVKLIRVADSVTQAFRRPRSPRARMEFWAMVGTLVLGLTIGSLIIITEGDIVDQTLHLLQSLQNEDAQPSRNVSANCRKAKNRNTPYCQEKYGRTRSDWRSMSKGNGGPGSAFSLGE